MQQREIKLCGLDFMRGKGGGLQLNIADVMVWRCFLSTRQLPSRVDKNTVPT